MNTNNTYHVRYEIEGGGKAIERMFIRQNEEAFFNFLADFKKEHPPLKQIKRRTKVLAKLESRISKFSARSSVSRNSIDSKDTISFGALSRKSRQPSTSSRMQIKSTSISKRFSDNKLSITNMQNQDIISAKNVAK